MRNNNVTITEKTATKSFIKAEQMLDEMYSKLYREFNREDAKFIKDSMVKFIKDKNIENLFKKEISTQDIVIDVEKIFRDAEEFSNNSKGHFEASIRVAAFVNNICSHLSDNMKKADSLLFMRKVNGIRDSFFPLIFGYKAVGSDK